MSVYKKIRYDIDSNSIDNLADTIIYSSPTDLEYDVDIGQLAYVDSLGEFVVFNGTVWKILISDDVAPAFSLSASAQIIDEGQSVVFELSAPYTADGVTVGYSITGDGINSAELGSVPINGTLTITSGKASVSINPSLDGITEGTETLTFTIASADNLGNPTGSLSLEVSINDVTVTTVSGEQVFTSPGSFTFTVPAGVIDISAVAIGGGGGGASGYYSYGSGGGGGGGGLAWMNGISCQPGDVFTVTVGSAGSRGSISLNTPFERVSSSSGSYQTFYPDSSIAYNLPSAGGDSSLSKDVVYITGNGGGAPSSVTGFGTGGAYYTNPSYGISRGGDSGNAGVAGQSGNSGVFPGGGGGAAGYGSGGGGGNGGRGRGDFYRSTGGYNYYKQAAGGRGGGTNIYGQGGTGTGGGSSPNLLTSTSPLVINYDAGGNGGTGSSAIGPTAPNSGGGAGGGGGGGAGGRIRDQAIITSYGARFYYRWFLGQDGSLPLPGAVRIIWGQNRSYPTSAN
jgi:hypothetical protein